MRQALAAAAAWLKGLAADTSGVPSSMRVMGLVVVTTVCGCWAYCVIRGGRWIPLDGYTCAILGAVFGSKAWQRHAEPGGGRDDDRR